MGALRNFVTKEPDWWEGGDVAYVEGKFYTFIGQELADEREVLRTAPVDSQDQSLYNYVFGLDGVNKKVTPIERGVISALLQSTKEKISKVKSHNLAKNFESQQIQSKMNELLGLLDHYAMQIQSRGSLNIKRTMMETVFRGDWTPTVDNTIPLKANEMCNPYNLKHFGGDSKAARYLGAMEDRYLVKAMEEKTKDHGLVIPGSMIFRFDTNVGWDSVSGDKSVANTQAIRVDSIGSQQHSHPLAEVGATHASFHTYVVREIISAAKESQTDRLIEIAQFLTTCKASKDEFKPPNSLKTEWKEAQKKGIKLPECKFWPA